jgi:hypothetical protein
MMAREIKYDRLIFSPADVDISFSPLRNGLNDTYVLGAFNPGLCRLPDGNLLMMVRVAEALSEAVDKNKIHSIRWDKENKYVKDSWPLSEVTMNDPRKFSINEYNFPVYALTSF